METRYTDMSYSSRRVRTAAAADECGSLCDAQRNMLLSCLLTEGLGLMAARLGDNFQPYLLKTLCLVLERVGTIYYMYLFIREPYQTYPEHPHRRRRMVFAS